MSSPALTAPRALSARGAIDELALRNRRLADIVEAFSRRRDVRELRAKLMLLVLHFACPLHGAPKQRWYVPGALARFGVDGILRTWPTHFGELAPSKRRMRSHLRALERAAALVRSPGDLRPMVAPREIERPRYPDTIHVVLDEREATWWAKIGRERLEREGLARHSAAAWRRAFGAWREEAHDPQLQLNFDELEDDDLSRDPRDGAFERAKEMAAKVRRAANLEGVLERLSATVGAGIALRGRVASELAANPDRLSATLLALSRELLRGRRVRNPAGWLVWAFRHGPGWID